MRKAAFRLAIAAAIVAVAFYSFRLVEGEDPIEAQASHYTAELAAITAATPPLAEPARGWTRDAGSRLARLKTQVAAVEAIARAVEHDLSAQSSGCRFASAAGNRIAAEIAPARAAMSRALDALRSGTEKRLKLVAEEDELLGWIGWRGRRQVEIYRLTLLEHDLAETTARAGLAFTQLRNTVATLNTVSVTCE